MEMSDIADPGLAEAGARRIDWADRAMPALRRVRDRFAAERPFDGLSVAAGLHVTAETAGLLRALAAGGARVALAASNPLSTQDDTAAALVAEHGIAVFARAGVDMPTYYAHLEAVLNGEVDLIFDDGGDLVDIVHERRPELAAHIIGGCEETTTGVLRAQQMAAEGVLRFPVIAVNDTATKRMFDNRYGTGQSTLDGIIRATNTLLAGKTVVIAGYGYCGKGLAERARGMGARVMVTEVDPLKALDAVLSGHTVAPMAQAAPLGDVFITATGCRDVIGGEHFAAMKDGAILANSGHFDVEIDVRALRSLATGRPVPVRPNADAYPMADGRRLILLTEGRLVNLGAAEGHPAAVMDLAFTAQALAAAWLAGHRGELAHDVHPVPERIDAEVAALKLATTGVRIDALTSDQQDYLRSWRIGTR